LSGEYNYLKTLFQINRKLIADKTTFRNSNTVPAHDLQYLYYTMSISIILSFYFCVVAHFCLILVRYLFTVVWWHISASFLSDMYMDTRGRVGILLTGLKPPHLCD